MREAHTFELPSVHEGRDSRGQSARPGFLETLDRLHGGDVGVFHCQFEF